MSTAAYNAAHREKNAAYDRTYKAAHREESRAQARAYNVAHREERAAYMVARREESAAWVAAHPEEIAAYKAAYRAAHRDEINAYGRAFYAANREEFAARSRFYLYGITQDEYDALLAFQEGLCAGCGEPMDAPQVDHDHSCCPGRRSCGRCIRGLVCWPCNLADALGTL